MSNPEVPFNAPEPAKSDLSKPKLNFFQRLIGVLFSPGETFQDINRKPDWIFPILFAIIFTVCANTVIFYRLNPNWDKVAEQVIADQKEKIARKGGTPQELSKEQQEQQLKVTAGIMRFTTRYLPPIIPIIYIFVHTLIFWGSAVLMGGITTFKKILSITAYINSVVVFGVQFLLAIIIVFIRNPEDINFLKGIATTNLGMILPDGSNPFLLALLTRFDIFTAWSMILMIIGLRAVCENMKKSFATGIVLTIWIVYIVVATLLGGLFG